MLVRQYGKEILEKQDKNATKPVYFASQEGTVYSTVPHPLLAYDVIALWAVVMGIDYEYIFLVYS